MHHSSRPIPASLVVLAAALLSLAPLAQPSQAGATGTAAIAIVDFSYVDSSGEIRDQRAAHAARLADFMTALRANFAATGKFRLVVPLCNPGPCSVASTSEPDLVEAARNAGADFLLIGGVHKMSTLVQWAKADAIDVRTKRIVLDKLFTFRGDTDEAWKHAEAFVFDEFSKLGT